MIPLLLVVLWGLAAAACGKDTKGPKAKAGDGTPRPDAMGQYEPPRNLPQEPCDKDSDCSLINFRPGSCCPLQCDRGPLALVKPRAQAIADLTRKVCGGFGNLDKYHCDPGPKCDRRGVPVARCQGRRCVLGYK